MSLRKDIGFPTSLPLELRILATSFNHMLLENQVFWGDFLAGSFEVEEGFVATCEHNERNDVGVHGLGNLHFFPPQSGATCDSR